MVPVTSILACIVTLCVSLVLPVLILILYAVRNKKQGIASAWFLGAAGFFVPQMLVRLPVLNAFSGAAWFTAFSQSHMFLYVFSLAVTAGLFELAGRFAVAKILEKKLTYRRALAAGLGHGGIEAIVIVGLTYVNNLLYIVMLNTGTFDALGAQLAAAGQDPAMLDTIRQALLGTSAGMFLLAGFERLLTMVIQAAMSMLVCWGVHTGKPGKAVLCCLGLHTLLDSTTGLSLLATEAGGNLLSQTTAYLFIYAILMIAAGLSLAVMGSIRSRWLPEAENGGKL